MSKNPKSQRRRSSSKSKSNFKLFSWSNNMESEESTSASMLSNKTDGSRKRSIDLISHDPSLDYYENISEGDFFSQEAVPSKVLKTTTSMDCYESDSDLKIDSLCAEFTECKMRTLSHQLKTTMERSIEETYLSPSKSTSKPESEVFLFKNSVAPLVIPDHINENAYSQKRPTLLKAKHIDGSESEDEDEKLRSTAVTADWVMKSAY